MAELFSVPKETVWGSPVDTRVKPKLLKAEKHRHHESLWCRALASVAGKHDVVMFSNGAVHHDGSQPGDHDGMRDGGSSAWTDFSQLRVGYCTKDQWLSAGNAAFWS